MPLPKIETHLTKTPLKANPGYDYSLGILYITRDEARKIAEFIQIIGRERITEKAYMPASAMIGGTAGAIVNRGIAVDKSEEPEQIAAPSNRFSELDIE